MALLGVDLGTTSCKAIAFNNHGQIIAASRRGYKILCPQHQWAETDPYELLDAVKGAIFEVSNACNEKILAMSFSSQGEGVVPLDDNYKPIGNIIVSYDRRTLGQTEKLREILGEDFFYTMGGQILAPMGTAPKIMWMLENPSYYPQKPSHFACVGDYIVCCFGGYPVIDYSLAARTMLYDIHGHKWSQKVLDVIGITDNILSKVQEAGDIVGTISGKMAEELNLPSDLIIVAGGHDQPCAMLGGGARGKGEAIYSLGTTETLVCSMENYHEGLKKYGLPCYPHVISNKYVTLPGNFTGGNLLQWYKDEFGGLETQIASDTNQDVYNILLANVEGKPSRLLVLPHFTITGSPYNDAKSTGAILGLQLDTKKGEFIKGLIEGVTYEILLNITLLGELGIEVSSLRAVGGGTKSAKLLQLKSDILGVPIFVQKDSEAPCKGAALLAAKGIGLVKNIETEWKEEEENIVAYFPNIKYNDYYMKQFEKYKLLYPLIKGII